VLRTAHAFAAPGGPAARDAEAALSSPLAFDAPGGPVVAVCGLAGGAGTTTLAWLLAGAAARASAAPVLLAELPAASGGLTALTGLPATSSLAGLIAAAAGGGAARPAPARGPDGLALLASPAEACPELPPQALRAALRALLAGARRRHGLVVLDCGTLHAPDARTAAALATHIVWTVPAGPPGPARAGALLVDRTLAPLPDDAREVLAVSATRPAALALRGHRELRAVAAQRSARLVLVPHVRALAAGRGSRQLATALAAIGGVLRLDGRSVTTQEEPPCSASRGYAASPR
jgi:hypothetical protein